MDGHSTDLEILRLRPSNVGTHHASAALQRALVALSLLLTATSALAGITVNSGSHVHIQGDNLGVTHSYTSPNWLDPLSGVGTQGVTMSVDPDFVTSATGVKFTLNSAATTIPAGTVYKVYSTIQGASKPR